MVSFLKKYSLHIFLFIACSLIFAFSILPSDTFVFPYTLSVERGDTVSSISKKLYENKIIRSRFLFETTILALGGEKRITEGDYLFEKPINVFSVAVRLALNDFGVQRVKITLPEGLTKEQMADIISKKLTNFDKEYFIENTKEGYLFPDTYLVFPSKNTDYMINLLTKNFDKKIDSLSGDIRQQQRSLTDIIIMASLIEKESSGDNDREIISGILWKRLDSGIPLQVDAPFLYVLGKQSSELTKNDLKIDSPYNTYRYKGLPPAPIGNPGLESIKAAIHPKSSPYFYYLHSKDGKVYYAKTFTEHVKNRIYLH